jgi:hypothetical protein
MKRRLTTILMRIIWRVFGNSSASNNHKNKYIRIDTDIHQLIVYIESDRMSPNMNIGDIVVDDGQESDLSP